MFNLFRRKILDGDSIDDSQAVIITIMLDGGEMGTDMERGEISKLEKDLTLMLSPRVEVDGHEYGEGEATIYLYGSDADAIFASIESRLHKLSFNHIDVTLRYGPPEDPKTQEKTFTL